MTAAPPLGQKSPLTPTAIQFVENSRKIAQLLPNFIGYACFKPLRHIAKDQPQLATNALDMLSTSASANVELYASVVATDVQHIKDR
ncbi:MAG: hypothetical protein AAFO75_06360 [Pseudomonadota bacterium]